jgi:hypothetical protein
MNPELEAFIAKMRALVEYVYPDDITPEARRLLLRVLDDEAEKLGAEVSR